MKVVPFRWDSTKLNMSKIKNDQNNTINNTPYLNILAMNVF